MTMQSFKKVESDCGKKEPCKWGCSLIIKFSHCLKFGYSKHGIIIFQFELRMAVDDAHTIKRICELNNFWYFF